MSTHDYDRTAANPNQLRNSEELIRLTVKAKSTLEKATVAIIDARDALWDVRDVASKVGIPARVLEPIIKAQSFIGQNSDLRTLNMALQTLTTIEEGLKEKLKPAPVPVRPAPVSPRSDAKPFSDMEDGPLNKVIEALVSSENLWMDGEVSRAQMPVRMRNLREHYRHMTPEKQQKMYQEYINGNHGRY
jgi:hypothetical protein